MPKDVEYLIDTLSKKGHKAYAVGGCVRDSILNKTPNDWDICTSALPQEIKNCFSAYKTIDTGIKHGTVAVKLNQMLYEITTFRIDGAYTDNRHPDSVNFTKNINDDLSRRDFTINAMAYNYFDGLVDPYGGKTDLERKIIRCVNNPLKRFDEDALRILRALRFSASLCFDIEKDTKDAIQKDKVLLKNIAYERISSELNKLLCSKNATKVLDEFRDVFAEIIPEIKPMFDYDQHTKHHDRDLWHHTLATIDAVDNILLLKITMLFHDLGKPYACKIDKNGVHHFKGHPKISADITEKILKRLKYPSDFIFASTTIMRFHDVRLSGNKSQLKHIMNYIGQENTALLLKLQYCDIMGQSNYKREEKLCKLKKANNAFKEILENNECYTLKSLLVNGNDLLSLGIINQEIGKTLKLLLSLVIDERLENNKTELIDYVKKNIIAKK